jgi:hypothetical protein
MHTHPPYEPKKFKQMSARKLMAAVFRGRKGVLIVEFIQQGTTTVSEVYYETLKKTANGPMCVCIQLLALEHCWSISTGNCLTTLLTALISLQVTFTCLPT